jgi:hypothetical protein
MAGKAGLDTLRVLSSQELLVLLPACLLFAKLESF